MAPPVRKPRPAAICSKQDKTTQFLENTYGWTADGPRPQRPPMHHRATASATLEPQQAELVQLRYFVGLKISEAAKILGIAERPLKDGIVTTSTAWRVCVT